MSAPSSSPPASDAVKPAPASPSSAATSSANSVAAPVREEMIGPAVRFLTDEKVKSAPMAKKVAFLESKGLTSEEINVAVARASGGTGAPAASTPPPVPVPSYAPVAPPLPAPAPWTAKDVVFTAAAIGGLGYASYALFTNYVLPKLPIPSIRDLTDSQTQFRAALAATSETVAAVQADAAKSLAQLHTDADALHTAATEAQKALSHATTMVTERDSQLAAVVKDMAELRDQVPKMVDQARDAQLAALSDLQNEIRSLRMAVVASSSPSVNQNGTASTDGFVPSGLGPAAAVPRTLVATPPPSLAVGPPKIPEWQVKAAKKAKATVLAPTPSSPAGNSKADADAASSSSSASAASSTPSSPVKENSETSSPVSAAN